MLVKRGQSGLCCIVGVDKPQGKSSHDIVNACRRIFGERRVGHTGTLDPLATGALAICVGPATRLDAYMVNHDKVYDVRISFGVATDTDDAMGQPIRTAQVPAKVCNPAFAQEFVKGLVGKHKQLPPAYSAIKKGGVKPYEAARAGNVIQLEPRDIEIYAAELRGLETDPAAESLYWDVRVAVSKGTYIRSLARDIGAALDSAAHVEVLRRVVAGRLDVEDCLTLEELEQRGLDAAIDPVFILGYRMAFLTDEQAADVQNGKIVRMRDLKFYDAPVRYDSSDCGPRRAAHETQAPLFPGETISLVHGNELKALYQVDAVKPLLRPACVFPQGVIRGKGF